MVHNQWLPRVQPMQVVAHIVLLTLSLLCLLPLWLVVSASFTDDVALVRNGFTLLPSKFSTLAYAYILGSPGQLLRSYLVSLVVTFVGTGLGLFVSALLAYALASPDFGPRRSLSFYVFFTMLFNGGLVPYYLLMTRYLHLRNSILALILPMMVVPFFVLLLRTYFTQLPQELFDAARIDGAGEYRIFLTIAMPLARPGLATVGLLLVLSYWNDWQTALYFIDDRALYPLQYLLYALLQSAQALAANPNINTPVPLQPVRMAMAVLATGPAAIAFLFFQKYLVRGLSLGSFK